MPVRFLTSAFPTILRKAGAVFTDIPHGNFGGGGFVTDFIAAATISVPAGAHYVLSLAFFNQGGIFADIDDVDNTAGGSPVVASVQKGGTIVQATLGTPNYGKNFGYNDSGGNPQTVVYSLNGKSGFWNGGFVLSLSTTPVTDNVPIVTLTLQVTEAADNFFDGDNPPQPARNLRGSPTPSADSDDPWDITITWDEPPNEPNITSIVYKAPPGSNDFVPHGTVPGGDPRFVDPFPNLDVVPPRYFIVIVRPPVPPDDGGESPPTPPIDVYYPPDDPPIFPPDVPPGTPVPPTLAFVATGGLNVGGAATVKKLINPSGIYTIVKDKTHDTLYDRVQGVTISVEVKIPDPFFKTGYLP